MYYKRRDCKLPKVYQICSSNLYTLFSVLIYRGQLLQPPHLLALCIMPSLPFCPVKRISHQLHMTSHALVWYTLLLLIDHVNACSRSLQFLDFPPRTCPETSGKIYIDDAATSDQSRTFQIICERGYWISNFGPCLSICDGNSDCIQSSYIFRNGLSWCQVCWQARLTNTAILGYVLGSTNGSHDIDLHRTDFLSSERDVPYPGWSYSNQFGDEIRCKLKPQAVIKDTWLKMLFRITVLVCLHNIWYLMVT